METSHQNLAEAAALASLTPWLSYVCLEGQWGGETPEVETSAQRKQCFLDSQGCSHRHCWLPRDSCWSLPRGSDAALRSIWGNTLHFASEENAQVKPGFLSPNEKLSIRVCGIGLIWIEHHWMQLASCQERGGLWQSLGTVITYYMLGCYERESNVSGASNLPELPVPLPWMSEKYRLCSSTSSYLEWQAAEHTISMPRRHTEKLQTIFKPRLWMHVLGKSYQSCLPGRVAMRINISLT